MRGWPLLLIGLGCSPSIDPTADDSGGGASDTADTATPALPVGRLRFEHGDCDVALDLVPVGPWTGPECLGCVHAQQVREVVTGGARCPELGEQIVGVGWSAAFPSRSTTLADVVVFAIDDGDAVTWRWLAPDPATASTTDDGVRVRVNQERSWPTSAYDLYCTPLAGNQLTAPFTAPAVAQGEVACGEVRWDTYSITREAGEAIALAALGGDGAGELVLLVEDTTGCALAEGHRDVACDGQLEGRACPAVAVAANLTGDYFVHVGARNCFGRPQPYELVALDGGASPVLEEAGVAWGDPPTGSERLVYQAELHFEAP